MKKLLLCMMFISSVALAQEKAYVIDDFSKGQNSHISEYQVLANQLAEATNVRINNKYKALANREPMAIHSTTAGSAIKSLHRYYLSDNTEYIIQTTGDSIYYDTNAGTMTEMRSDMGSNLRYQWFTYQDTAIGINASDKPVKWDGETQTTDDTDGSRTAGDLMAELGAPYAELNTGSNLDSESWYQYKIAYYDGSTYFYSSARSNPILTGATVQDITLTDIPLGPGGTTARYLYRTLGNASKAAVLADTTFYLIHTFSDDTTTTYDDDMIDDTADDDAVPTWSTVSAGVSSDAPIGGIGAFHKDRFFKNSSIGKSYIYWSEAYLPHFFASEDTEIIREDDGDKIEALVEYLGMLRIFKTNTIQNWHATSTADANWYYSPPFSSIGCHAPYSVAVTPIGILYINRDGLFAFNGQREHLISDAVTDIIKDISESDISDSVGIYFDNEYLYSYTSSESGEGNNNRILLYDIIRDAYVVDTKTIDSFAVFNSSDDYGVIYGGDSTTAGRVWSFETNPAKLIQRRKSEFELGTFDKTRIYNTEDRPILEIARDQTIDELVGTIDDLTGTIDRDATSGTWTSPIYTVNAGSLDKLYWNESLNQGDVTYQVRTGEDDTAIISESWSSAFTDPTGSDLSDITAAEKYQLKINLSTPDETYTPNVYYSNGYVSKTIYFKTGASSETGISSTGDTGWRNLYNASEADIYNKRISRIRVFYEGTEGTLNLQYENEEGDVDYNFDIDLSISSNLDIDDDNENEYTVNGLNKIRTFYPKANYSEDQPESIGQFFRFVVSSIDAEPWTIHKIEVRFELIPFDD